MTSSLDQLLAKARLVPAPYTQAEIEAAVERVAARVGAVLVALARMRDVDVEMVSGRDRRRGMVREGLRYVLGRRDLLVVVGVMAFVGTFGLNFQLTSALMATHVYGKGAGE